MSELSFKLDAFEGPLDLLLYLISKHKLNIYDIEIALLLDQYMEYIDSIEDQDFDTAGDFLAMAARLVYIKTCSLLPQAEEAEELKKELQGDLLEYSVCKQAAARLREICVYGDVFVRPPEKIPVNKTFTGTMPAQKLVDAYMGMSAKARSLKPVRAEKFSPIVAARFVTVTSKIVFVLKKLYRCGECTMDELYSGIDDKSARVATFLAILELTKSGRVSLNDDNTLISFNRDSKRKHSRQKTYDEHIETADALKEDDDTEQSFSQETDHNSDISEEIELEISEPYAGSDNWEKISEPAYQADAVVPREKYVLEQRKIAHSLTVTIDGNSDEDNSFDTLAYDTEKINCKNDAELQTAICVFSYKLNRFSARYRWGYPESTENCWIYGRERS